MDSFHDLTSLDHSSIHTPSQNQADSLALMDDCFLLERCSSSAADRARTNEQAAAHRLPPPQKFPKRSCASPQKTTHVSNDQSRLYFKRLSNKAMGQVISQEESADWSLQRKQEKLNRTIHKFQ